MIIGELENLKSGHLSDSVQNILTQVYNIAYNNFITAICKSNEWHCIAQHSQGKYWT